MEAAWIALAVAAAGVSYDWRPTGDADGGVEYVVAVEPELVEALERGDTRVLESNVPAEVGPVRRVRIVLGDTGGVKRRVERPTDAPESAARHIVNQAVAGAQLEAGFQQGAPSFDAAPPPSPGAPLLAQASPDSSRTVGSELRGGAGRLFGRAGSAVRNTGEAVRGTARNLRNGVRGVLPGRQPAAQPQGAAGSLSQPAGVAGSGDFVPFSYQNQPTATPGFGSPVAGVNSPLGGGVSAAGSSTLAPPFGAQPPAERSVIAEPPPTGFAPLTPVASDPATTTGVSRAETAPVGALDSDRYPRGSAADPINRTILDPPRLDPPAVVSVFDNANPRERDTRFDQPSRTDLGTIGQPATGGGFSDAPSFGSAGFGSAAGQQLDSLGRPITGPSGGLNGAAGMPNAGPPAFGALGSPGTQGGLAPPMGVGAAPPSPSTIASAGLPTDPREPPWNWMFSTLIAVGSIGGNLFLGWSYLDARNKYRSALRRTSQVFGRRDASDAA